jgi:hypothetical protein
MNETSTFETSEPRCNHLHLPAKLSGKIVGARPRAGARIEKWDDITNG